jgi:hypothetical protein
MKHITNVSTIVANAALSIAMGGTPSHDRPKGFFSAPSGVITATENSISVFSHVTARLSFFEDDIIPIIHPDVSSLEFMGDERLCIRICVFMIN